jgi:transglutaminase-like putative cysteine protease
MIPSGVAGTRATLRQMAALVRRGSGEWATREAVSSILRSVPAKDTRAQAMAIRGWCQSRIQFLADPYGQETLFGVDLMLAMIARDGKVLVDCDDAAILSGALAASAGMPVRFVAITLLENPNEFVHVWAECMPLGTGAWIEFDVTRPFQHIPVERIGKMLIHPVFG